MRKIIFFTAFFIFSTFAQKVQFEPNAAIDKRIDEILQTLSSRSDVALPAGFYQQPANYEEIRKFLINVEKSENLTATDKNLLKILKDKYFGNTKLAEIRDDDDVYRLLLNLDLTGQAKFNGDLDAGGIINPKITANLGIFSFYSDLHVSTQYRSDTVWTGGNYEPFRGKTYNAIGGDSSHFRAIDGFRAGISTQTKRTRVDIAVDNLTSGPAAHNRLMLNAVDKPIFYTRIMLDFDKLQYYQIFGILKEFRHYSKYLYYHRVQLPLFENKITLGINASVISGSTADSAKMSEPSAQYFRPDDLNRERKIEPIYIIPFIPYFFAEHYTGDLDNKQIGLDLEVKMPKIARWYAEFFIDDGSAPHTLFNDGWGNKWAITVGTQWYPVIAGKNAIFGFEYCRVEPWVYTHFRGVSTNYEHYGKSIGAELGPNSSQIRGLSQFNFSQKHAVRLEAVYDRFNRKVRGGNIGDVFVYNEVAEDYEIPADNEKKEFLGNDFTKNYTATISYIFRQFSRFEMETSVFYEKENGAGIGVWGGFRF
ncbi:MAG: hypothetical protein FWF51_01405 [Chitinivibrionia bacterium]|nr:hypothetical protein [Chitinivibrionia bacterium]